MERSSILLQSNVPFNCKDKHIVILIMTYPYFFKSSREFGFQSLASFGLVSTLVIVYLIKVSKAHEVSWLLAFLTF
jgi:hypothetical protein